jgi:CheY-like chemotaxis protein
MNKHTILWADDDPDDLETFREVLHSLNQNYEVLEFSNGQELLDFLKASDLARLPCLIILDMNMPVLGGRETLSILKNDASFQSIPVVVFTTSNSELDKVFCSRLGTEMITKPPSYGRLRDIVQKLLSFCDRPQEEDS